MEFQSMECEGSSGANDTQYKENETSGGADCLYKCEMCRKSFETEKYLGLHMQVHVEESDKFCEESKFINNLIENDAIEIKSEFSEEDTTINFGEFHNDFAENADGRSKMTDFGLILVKKEQSSDVIKTQPKSDIKGIKDAATFSSMPEFIICGTPSDLVDTNYSETNYTENHPHSVDEIKTESKSRVDLDGTELDARILKCDKPSDAENEPSGTNSSYICSHCKKSFSTKYSLIRHTKLHSGKPQHKCGVCRKQFSTSSDLTRHHATHSKRIASQHKCDFCNKTLTTKKSLLRHKNLHTDQLHKCEFCGKEFLFLSGLSKHMSKHAGPFPCETCNKTFTKRENLNIHIKLHTEERQFTCGVCNKHFSRKNNLLRHMRVHSGEKPFNCEFCNDKFSEKSSLERHLLRLHSGEGPYKCDICEKTFRMKMTWKRYCKRNCQKLKSGLT